LGLTKGGKYAPLVKAALERLKLVPKPLLLFVGIVVVAAILGPLFLGGGPSLESLEKLEKAQASGEEASTTSDRIRRSLREIADNLEEGAGISTKGDRIGELTAEQQRSLRQLVAVLETQLDVLDRSSELVGETTESTESLADISAAQAANLKDAIVVLRNVEGLAADATARSTDLTRQARYGARLAEDSEEAFRP
jgi:uncharacterized membrane protein